MNETRGGEPVNSASGPDPIHDILASEESIVPSSGFLAAVMERVEEESRAPAPIPFPWRRAMLAIPLIAGVFGWGVYEFTHYPISLLHSGPVPHLHLLATPAAPLDQAAWIALALTASMLSWKLVRRLTGLS